MASPSRFRNWFFVAYPESMPANWKEIIEETHVPCLVSPLHDRDLREDGSFKTAHYHILVMYGNVKTLKQFQEDFLTPLHTSVYQVARDLGGCARYLCHLDNPEKTKYEIGKVQAFNGAMLEEVMFSSGAEYDCIATIMKFCEENQIYQYWDLCKYALNVDRTWAPIIINRTVFWVGNLKSLKDKHMKNDHSYVDTIIEFGLGDNDG